MVTNTRKRKKFDDMLFLRVLKDMEENFLEIDYSYYLSLNPN